MAESRTIVVKLVAGKTSAGQLYAYADPDPAVMYVGDIIKWRVVAKNGVKNVKPAHFRHKGNCMESAPFTKAPERKQDRSGAVEFTAQAMKSGLIRIYKYDIMVGEIVVADPDVQIKDR